LIRLCVEGEKKKNDRKDEDWEYVPTSVIVDITDNIKTAPFLTGLAPSSIIEKVGENEFKQNF